MIMTNLLLLGFLPSGSEWIIIALVILLLFGGKKIPELMRGMGRGVKEFKDAVNKDYTAENTNETTAPTAPQAPRNETTKDDAAK